MAAAIAGLIEHCLEWSASGVRIHDSVFVENYLNCKDNVLEYSADNYPLSPARNAVYCFLHCNPLDLIHNPGCKKILRRGSGDSGLDRALLGMVCVRG